MLTTAVRVLAVRVRLLKGIGGLHQVTARGRMHDLELIREPGASEAG